MLKVIGKDRCIQRLVIVKDGEVFAKEVNDFQQLNIFTKSSIFNTWQGSEHASEIHCQPNTKVNAQSHLKKL